MGGLKTVIQELKTQQSTISGKVLAEKNNINNLNFEVNRLEQYSRKSSVRVYGIPESDGENLEDKVIEKIKEEIGIDVKPEEIGIVHRVGKRSSESSRGILIKFVSHKTKVKVMRKKSRKKYQNQ